MENAEKPGDMISDGQSMSSFQQSEISKRTGEKKSKKSKKDEPDDKADMDKKKMKVLKEAIKEMQKKEKELIDENKKLKTTNDKVEKELADKKYQYSELFEENHKLHDSMLVLQQKMADEMGINSSIDVYDSNITSKQEESPYLTVIPPALSNKDFTSYSVTNENGAEPKKKKQAQNDENQTEVEHMRVKDE